MHPDPPGSGSRSSRRKSGDEIVRRFIGQDRQDEKQNDNCQVNEERERVLHCMAGLLDYLCSHLQIALAVALVTITVGSQSTKRGPQCSSGMVASKQN